MFPKYIGQWGGLPEHEFWTGEGRTEGIRHSVCCLSTFRPYLAFNNPMRGMKLGK
jgi:hypothetical protein